MNVGKSMSLNELRKLAHELYGPTAYVIGSGAYTPQWLIEEGFGRASLWVKGQFIHGEDDNYVLAAWMRRDADGKLPKPFYSGAYFDQIATRMLNAVLGRQRGASNLSADIIGLDQNRHQKLLMKQSRAYMEKAEKKLLQYREGLK